LARQPVVAGWLAGRGSVDRRDLKRHIPGALGPLVQLDRRLPEERRCQARRVGLERGNRLDLTIALIDRPGGGQARRGHRFVGAGLSRSAAIVFSSQERQDASKP
jgi:hypothetical protein